MVKKKDSEYLDGKTDKNTKEIGKRVKDMEKEY